MVWQGNYTSLFIGGEWVEPATDNTIGVVSPFTEQALARIPAGSGADVDRAVRAAREAFDHGPWPRMSLSERMDVVRRFGKAITENRESIAALITDEMGCPITQTVASQSGAAIALIDTNLELVEQYPWRTVRRSNTGNALVTRVPIGVVAAVVPWNAPLSVAMLKLVPALLSGCTVILKPSPEAPLSSYLLAEMVQAAGFPAGVMSIVTADRAESEYLVTHPGVNKVSFTGSTLAGRRIASLCGNDLRRYTLELGGKSAAIVLDDADIASAASMAAFSVAVHAGQGCALTTRLLVPRESYDDAVEVAAATMSSLGAGDPANAGTICGPVISAVQRDRILGYLALAEEEGGRIATGGAVAVQDGDLADGFWIQPTVVAGLDNTARVAREEIFGPVLTVIAHDGDDDAVRIANDSPYGLSGSVESGSLERAKSVAARIRTGTIGVNGGQWFGPDAPFGGYKQSGLGREMGVEGFEEYLETKLIAEPA